MNRRNNDNTVMPFVTETANIFINRILAMDAETASMLEKYNGRVLAVEFTDTRFRFYAAIEGGGVHITDTSAVTPDVTVRGTPAEFMAFLRMFPGGGSPAAVIEITGDVGLAQDIQGLARRLEPDWEESLSQWLGDTPARKLANLIRRSRRYLAYSGTTLATDISEYLRYETEILPERSEVNEFNDDVDALRHDVERLKVRIARLRSPGASS